MSKKSAGSKRAPERPAERPVRPRSRRSAKSTPAAVPVDPTPVENVDPTLPGGTPATSEPAAPAADTGRARSRHERVAERAYALYRSRGAQGGDDLSDWLEAERQIAREDRSSERPE